MKLIGSKTEKEIKEQLIKSNQALFKNSRIIDFIKNEFADLKTAYVLHWIPKQGEEIHMIAL